VPCRDSNPRVSRLTMFDPPGRNYKLLPALAKSLPPATFFNASRPPSAPTTYSSKSFFCALSGLEPKGSRLTMFDPPGRNYKLLPALAKSLPPATFLNASRPPSAPKKRHLSTDKRRFFELCVPIFRNVMFAMQVMYPTGVMCAFCTFSEHITSLCSKATIHHCLRSEQHHLCQLHKQHFIIYNLQFSNYKLVGYDVSI